MHTRARRRSAECRAIVRQAPLQILLILVLRGRPRRSEGEEVKRLRGRHRRGRGRRRLETGGDERDDELLTERWVDLSSEDDLRIWLEDRCESFSNLAHLLQRHRSTAQHRVDEPTHAPQLHVEQRRRDGRLDCAARPLLPLCAADAHEAEASACHDGAHVSEIDVDQLRRADDGGDAADSLPQHLVGGVERLGHRRARRQDLRQPVVLNGDEHIHVWTQFGSCGLCHRRALRPLETEGERHHRDDESADGAANLADDGRPARAGTAAEPRRHEDDVCAVGPL
mmetsp:Transcript_22620/g.52111  ORF Transcript_22620/g.52111 Transcript_22620/m.52111 type:complete len:283 (-) Transcript_22620:699-1547(-)